MRFTTKKSVKEQEQTKIKARTKLAESRIAAGRVRHGNVDECEVIDRLRKLL